MSKSQVSEFEQQVYDKVLEVPAGKVTTYGRIAKALGNPKMSRAVGAALRKNPFAPRVPCHRVVMNNWKIGGYFGGVKDGLVRKKVDMLRKEGIQIEVALNDIYLRRDKAYVASIMWDWTEKEGVKESGDV